jgi:hypothetical protein
VKPIPAIVEKAQVDVDLVEKQLAVALAGERDARNSAERHEKLGEAARATEQARRTEIGRLLLKARGAWPERGPNAKGWGEFLKRVQLDDSTAHRYMQEAKDPSFLSRQRAVRENSGAGESGPAPVNGNGGSGDPARGTYCTPAKYAAAVGAWDLDPFSNPRSRIVSRESCQLERGDNGLLDPELPGSYLLAGADRPTEPFDIESDDAIVAAAARGRRRATESTRVWIQPPYSIVEAAIAHYGHTRFCALLRFDPSTEWFAVLWKLTRVVAIPFGERLEFEGPPDIETSANPYPHAFYYADERDVTPAIRELCIVLRVEHSSRGGDVSLDEPA